MSISATILLALSLSIWPTIPKPYGDPFGQSGSSDLPEGVTDQERLTIERASGTRSRVDAALKIAESRLGSGLSLLQQGQGQESAKQLIVYSGLIGYVDRQTRALPESKQRDREQCLKKIEQAIFKQSPRLESLLRDLPLAAREICLPLAEEVRKIRLHAINDLLGGGSAIKLPENRMK